MKRFTLKAHKSDFPRVQVKDSEDSYNVIKKFFHEDVMIYESCYILLLDRSNTTIGWAKISQGGVSGTVVDPKIICKYAVDSLASGVILAHNHPSGNIKPSEEDKALTQKIKKALSYIDCTLLDHLIITEDYYSSFVDKGLL